MRYAIGAVLAMFTATALVTAADEVFVVLAATSYPTVWAALNNAVTGAESLVFGAVGLLIVARRGGAVGWLLSAMGLVVATMAATSSYPRLLSPTAYVDLGAGPMWLAPWWAWVGSIAWLSAVTLLLVFVQVFPDGRPLSPGWRLPLLLALVWPLWFLAVAFLSPVTLQNGKDIPNPSGLSGPLGDVMLALKASLSPLTAAVALAAVGSVLLRYRRSAGQQRAQLKWFAYGAAVVIGSFALSGLFLPPDLSNLVNGLAICVLPLSVAAAILRHGLYDIDLLVNRTLVYGTLSAMLIAAYIGSVVVLHFALRSFTQGSEIAVAASTLFVVALFQPVRRRLQDAVDRRFYRRKYDAARTVSAFSGHLRQQVDLEALQGELVEIVRDAVQPTQVSLWLFPARPRN